MKRWAAWALMGAVPVQAFAQAVPVAPPAVVAPLKTQLLADRYVTEARVAGISIAFARGKEPTQFVSAGRLAFDPRSPVAGPDSLWRVYSMTKPITGMAAMILVEQGRLKLDQPISDFIPAFKTMRVLTEPSRSLASRPATTPITVRHLLTHTAGLGYNIVTKGPLLNEYNRLGINPSQVSLGMETVARAQRPATLAEFADRVASVPLIAEPGTTWSYSIGLDVLGRVIEVASKQPFDAFVQRHILGPLKMTSSYWTVPAGAVSRLATNYMWLGERPLPLDPGGASVYARAPSFPYGGSGLVMSARDYDRFLAMLQNWGMLDGVRVMKPETARLAMSNLLPHTVSFNGVAGTTGGTQGVGMGYGAGGSVSLADGTGQPKGTYGWGGAAGTIGFVNPERSFRATVMVNYMPAERFPLRADATPALLADLTR